MKSVAKKNSTAARGAPSVRIKKASSARRSLAGSDVFYGRGRRKNAVAKAWILPGNGGFVVNNRPLATYFARPVYQSLVHVPFEVTNTVLQYDVVAQCSGGGLTGQAGALRLAIAWALAESSEDFAKLLRQHKLLTRDPRVVERKKYGLRKSRKRPQFSKR